MAHGFLSEDFLLRTETARRLYHEHAGRMPIYDYHCHLPPAQIAEDKQFDNLTQVWLYGDHYKWRAMRSNGIAERFCTGDASDYEKFEKWAETVPRAMRNQLYHWSCLELKRYFGVDKLLGPDTAGEIYETCSELLRTSEYSARNLMRRMNVSVVCTTDDPLDSLEHHKKVLADGFEIKVLPTWRPDKALLADDVGALNDWIDELARGTGADIKDYASYLQAIRKRHDFFHEAGCRLSDHAMRQPYAEDYTEGQIRSIFQKIISRKQPDASEILRFNSAVMVELALMNHEKGWTQQFHLGAIRNTNTRMLRTLGPDTGFDTMGDFEIGPRLARYLDRLDADNKLAKTILYNSNPRDNELMATMIGNFQDGSVPGKIQFGPSWWFLDQKNGISRQLEALSNMGLLSRFVGMVTDSRSFLSYPRHEYFRRVLCDILGSDVENGELPEDMELLGQMVEDICFGNAREYFDISTSP
ncbi:MAG: glucuronate isomerase [Planctomycetota bacterium]|nr:glucuronate isomerase [Planctomycetota bacterium]